MSPAAPPPPAIDPLVALADRCVQCGLCLPACPTYGHDRLEAESPRGRIALVRAWAMDTIEPTMAGDAHLDHCLACRSCEAVCPAGVKYGELLVAARSRQRERRGGGLGRRLMERVSARPALLSGALIAYRWGYRWLPARLRFLPRPPRPPRPPSASPGLAKPATGNERIALFVGCVAAPYEATLRSAVVELCSALGVEAVEPPGQACCGSLHAHAGNASAALRLADRNRRALGTAGTVLTLASGCHESVATALGNGVGTFDAITFMEARGEALRWRECRERVALHLPCTQRNVVRSVDALRRLLARVPGLEVIELDAGFGCCGAAGTHMVTDPARADDYRQPLLAQVDAAGATRLLSANIGCRLHFANANRCVVQHPLEFLAGLLDRPDIVKSAP